jgi:hypothetical protein
MLKIAVIIINVKCNWKKIGSGGYLSSCACSCVCLQEMLNPVKTQDLFKRILEEVRFQCTVREWQFNFC